MERTMTRYDAWVAVRDYWYELVEEEIIDRSIFKFNFQYGNYHSRIYYKNGKNKIGLSIFIGSDCKYYIRKVGSRGENLATSLNYDELREILLYFITSNYD